jgi:hypothetical protein
MPKRKLSEIMNGLDQDQIIKSFGYLTVKEKQEKQEKQVKVRKNVDYPWSEYIVYIVCKAGPKIIDFAEIESTFDETVPKGYLKDISRTNPKTVMDYYNRFYEEFQKMDLKVLKVFLLGKNQNRFPEIKQLHLNLVNVKLKADIIVKTQETFIGFSVKTTPNDTLTNYSIYKMLEPEQTSLLKLTQKSIIVKNGLSTDRTVYRSKRESYNRLFANGSTIDNDYHRLLNQIILENSETVLRQWYKNLFGELPYRLYTFNGTTLTNESISPLSIDIKPIVNPAKHPEGAAKLFYALYENDKIIYKWEIRWKGDIFVSPQILTFKWNPERDQLKLIEN